MGYYCCFIPPFNDNDDTTGTASSYGLLATRDTRACVCVCICVIVRVYKCMFNVYIIYVCTGCRLVCALCPTRVPPEIKTCNFVVVNVRRIRARVVWRLTRYYHYRGTSRSHVKNCFPTRHRLVHSELHGH